MKRHMLIVVLTGLFTVLLSSCSLMDQEKDGRNVKKVTISADSEEAAIAVVRNFAITKLEHGAYGGVYIEAQPEKRLVLLIQKDFPVDQVITGVADFMEEQNQSGTHTIELAVKTVNHSHDSLGQLIRAIRDSEKDLISTGGNIHSLSLNEIENRVEMAVSSLDAVNMPKLDELTNNDDTMILLSEGIMNSLKKDGTPTAEPTMTGSITSIDSLKRRILVDDQIYFFVDEHTTTHSKKTGPLSFEQLEEGDKVSVWADGPIMESMPARAYAVFILRK